jgi:hypothetical protein
MVQQPAEWNAVKAGATPKFHLLTHKKQNKLRGP